MASRTIKVAHDSPLAKKLIARIGSRIDLAEKSNSDREAIWARAEEITMCYVPESEADNVRRNKREVHGEQKYTTIMIPYTFGMLMSAHTYWTSVFFARSPVHQFAGLHGETEMQVQALEALISYQVEIGEMLAPYYIWLYDAGKYGHGVLGSYWCEEMIHYGQIAEMDLQDGKGPQLFQATHEIPGYKGNKVYNISPYDFNHDPRVPITRFQDGEFCVVTCRLGWWKILERAAQGYYQNLDRLSTANQVDRNATKGSSIMDRPDFSEQFDEGMDDDGKDKPKHPSGAVLKEVYIRLIPSEWDLGSSTYPQLWCITLPEDRSTVLGASPLGLLHDKFPVDVIEMEIEGYGKFNRGVPEIMEGVQTTIDWLINTHFYNIRASMNNQFIVDPSKLVIKDVANSHQPGFIWRLRPEAYGTDINKMFAQIPVTDATRMHFTDVGHMLGVGERTLGVNDQIMGVLNQGGRKTATEIRTSTGFGVNRQKTVTEWISAQGFAAHARKLTQNSQQFYQYDAKLRIVGDLATTAGPQFMDVTPDMIAGYYLPIPVDGTLPVDRMAQANLWKEVLMGLTRMPPQISMTYDMNKIFAWMASLGGLKNINQMKVQMGDPAMLAAQAQAGNVVPLRGGPPPGATQTTQTGLNSLFPPAEASNEGVPDTGAGY
jgi:hypothetical protein